MLSTTALVVLPLIGVGRSPVAAAASDPVMVIAGDISCGPTDGNFGGGNSAYCQQRQTANLVAGIAPQYLLPGGDTQYTPSESEGQQPLASDFTNGYGASWGQLQNSGSGNFVPGLIVRPTPGDHEYGDANEDDRGMSLSDASHYYTYFGGLGDLPAGVTGASNDFYSFDVPVNGGTWHIISLDSECAALPSASSGGLPSGGASGCAQGSPEETFLQSDLAAHQGECTLIHWHEPEFSEGFSGNTTDYQQFWNDAYQYHVAAIVNGHDHDYERWAPQNPSGTPDANGVTEIVAGTGGNSLGPQETGGAVADDFSHFGVLKLTLHAGSADFAFVKVGGATGDTGTISCDPVVSGVSSSSGPVSGGNSVTVTGTNFVGTPTVHFGSNLGSNVTVSSPTSLTATVPSGSTGTVDVTVTNAATQGAGVGGPTSSTGAADQYTYGPAPTVTSVSPNLGSSAGGTAVTVSGTNLGGASAVDFGANPATGVVVNGGGTSLTVTAPAGAVGAVDVTVTTSVATSATSPADRFTYQKSGYWMVGNDGGVFSFGGAPFEGSVPSLGIHIKNIVAMVPTADSKGYWMIGSDGGVFAFGDAGFVGSLPGINVHVKNVVAVVPTADSKGYWMIGSDGGIFAFGDAGFVGSLPGIHVHLKNVVGAVPTSTGKGYWMVGSDGGVFAFGDAGFVGSIPGLNVHVNNIVAFARQ
ncbi:MAG TPA: IPT/TIG domain-containing protein [Acidimicrobiales bacterium]